MNEQLLEKLKPEIGAHIQNRIQLYMTQLIVAYKTGIVFFESNAKAIFQYGLPTAHKDFEISNLDVSDYAAAHSSTLPTLRFENSQEENTSRVFLKGSTLFQEWNTTVYLPVQINEADSAIDKSPFGLPRGCQFRAYCIRILNEVSKGSWNPTQGLHEFLQKLKITIAYKMNGSSSIVWQVYNQYATLYSSKVCEEGDALFKKVFFRMHLGHRGEDLYLALKNEMLETLEGEMKALAPPSLITKQLSPDFHIDEINKLIEEHLSQNKVKGDTALDHIARSFLDQAVKNSAMDLLNHLNALDNSNKTDLLKKICLMKTKKTLPNLSLDAKVFCLWENVHNVIKTDAQNKPYILLSIMHKTLHPWLQQSIPLTIPQDKKQSFVDLLNKRAATLLSEKQIDKSPTDTTRAYSKTCASVQVIQEKAKEVFLEIDSYSKESLKIEKIDQILLIATEKNLSSNLSKEIIQLFNLCLNKIRKDKNKETSTPKKMGTIIADTICFSI